jgi:DNA repair protein RecO (recombination protein O)
MATFRDAAIVLRTHKLAEADRIATLLTRDHGKVRAVVKGVRRPKSRFGGRLEPFMHVDLQLYEGRSLDTVTQAVTLAAYAAPLAASYPAFTAANAVVEAADKLSPVEHIPARALFRLTLGAVAALARSAAASPDDLPADAVVPVGSTPAATASAESPTAREDGVLADAAQRNAQAGPAAVGSLPPGRTVTGPASPGAVVDSYLLRALALSGYAPSLSGCAHCGAPGPHRAFSPASGGMVCQSCRPPGAAAPAGPTVTLLGALLEGDWPTVSAAPPTAAAEAASLVRAFAEFHIERAIRSLRLLDRP